MNPNKTSIACDVEGILNDRQDSCVEVHVAGLIPVVYEIHLDDVLQVPYAIIWNGRKQPEARVARMASGKTVAFVRVLARPGQKVALYLGSDASPRYRNEELYPVVVGVNDIQVVIKTRRGLDASEAVAVKSAAPPVRTAHGDMRETYEGTLNGKIWMRFSHRYSEQEALEFARESGESDAGILRALHTVYSGGVARDLGFDVNLPHGRCRVGFQQDADGNCRENIHGYQSARDFGPEVLTRVHPNCWLGLLNAARQTQTVSLILTSTWRPLKGKMPHRLGLGLDVKQIKNAKGEVQVFDLAGGQVFHSREEKEAHDKWRSAQSDLTAISAMQSALRSKTYAIDLENSRELLKAARQSYDNIVKQRLGWTFEGILKTDARIRQLYSPIDMDDDTHDKSPSVANNLKSPNEKAHTNHVHVTASDRFLLP